MLVWRDVGGGEEPPPVAQLPRPPVLVGPVRHGEDVAPPELELPLLLKVGRRFWPALKPAFDIYRLCILSIRGEYYRPIFYWDVLSSCHTPF